MKTVGESFEHSGRWLASQVMIWHDSKGALSQFFQSRQDETEQPWPCGLSTDDQINLLSTHCAHCATVGDGNHRTMYAMTQLRQDINWPIKSGLCLILHQDTTALEVASMIRQHQRLAVLPRLLSHDRHIVCAGCSIEGNSTPGTLAVRLSNLAQLVSVVRATYLQEHDLSTEYLQPPVPGGCSWALCGTGME